MKIDLHIHTKDDDKNGKRKISDEDLILKLKENDVYLASVTEHCTFDIEQFNFLKKNNENINFIPGIELDVKLIDSQEYKQIILYCENKDFVNSFNEKKYPIMFDDLILLLSEISDQILLSFHFLKDEKRSFSLEEIKQVQQKIDKHNNIFIMLEAPSLMRAGQKKYDLHISSFSDIKDWEKYSYEILPEIENVKNLTEYINEFVKNKTNVATFSKTNTNYSLGIDYDGKTIPLSRGLNIVFGKKGSGKTNLLTKFNEKNNNFEWIQFSDFSNVKKLSDLYSWWIDKNANDPLVKKHIEQVNEMRERETFNYSSSDYVDFDLNSFRKNYAIFNQNSQINKYKNNVFLINDSENNMTLTKTKLKQKRDSFDYIDKKLNKILKKISDENYTGSLKIENIINFIEVNIEDWKNTIQIIQKNFNATLDKNISDKFGVSTKPKIGLEKLSEYWSEIAIENARIFNSLNSKIKNFNKEMVLVNSNILNVDEEYNLTLSMLKRGKGNETSSKDIPSFSSGDRTNHLLFYNKINEKQFSFLIERFDLTEISCSDLYNIFIESKFGNINEYIPSTGQMDMLHLDEKLKQKNGDFLIDEFCNSLDNEYIFNTLVDKMNDYNGKILASTHNPIISVIPEIKNYFYTEKNNDNYDVFYSDKGINGELININDEKQQKSTKETLVKVIEGTEKAFIDRGSKYGIK